MRRIGRTDPATPVPGRTWYAGAWRTPDEIERRRSRQATTRPRVSVDRRRTTDEEKQAAAEARRVRTNERARRRRVDDPEWAERDRARQRGRYVPRERKTRIPDEVRSARAAKKRIEATERRLERARVRAAERANAPTPPDVPSAVRRAYGDAQAGSAIKRKYPTWRALRAGARRGDFDRWRV